ncbi:hypothetical protein MSAN_01393300 [Mycena sanguinolenta]|uniref:Uncharacterized protein n=1 Tax=Mycena sanguinolenta TaxID=230812 RepID=A0A8H7D0M1_9AGAR|nr:hypothetical protein MSAN_01393300 [Mycena sanguinolenta]
MYVYIDSTIVRLIFRAVFTILFLCLGVLGRQSNKLATKLRLLHNGKIPVPQAAGWLPSSAIFDPIWKLRHIPNVRWWSLVAVLAILSKCTDLATAVVRSESLRSYCAFGNGMVLQTNGADSFSLPPWNGRAAFVAGNAQVTSLLNGCDKGIYRKVNTDINFCASPSDIFGTWQCLPDGEDITYKSGSTQDEVLVDLYQNDRIFGPDWISAATNTNDTQLWTHLVVWSSSALDSSHEVFSVKASVDLTANRTDDKIMHSMYCTLNAPEAEDIAKAIPSVSTLASWVMLFQGYMYNGMGTVAINDPEDTLAWYLNTMIMVAGGSVASDYLLNSAPATDPTQGCLLMTTVIPTWVLALFFLTILACIAMTLLTFVLWIRVNRHPHRDLVRNAPVDLWTWMAQAVAESDVKADGMVNAVLPKDLRKWNLELTPGTTTVRIEKRKGEMAPLAGVGWTGYTGYGS